MDQPMWNVATLPGALGEEGMLQESRSGRYDGWWAFLLLFFLFFGPTTAPTPAMPVMRSSDAVIVLMLVLRWGKANRHFGGFMFRPRLRAFALCMLGITAVLLVSTMISTAIGRFPFNPKDYFTPIACARMAVIAAIMASFTLEERQLKQLVLGILIIGLMAGILAIIQRYRSYWVSGFIERYYGLDIELLETRGFRELSRVSGTFGNPNTYSTAMLAILGPALATILNSKGFLRWVAVATAGVLVCALVMTTGSRTGFFAMLAMCGMAAFFSMQGRAKISALVVAIILVFLYMWLRASVDELPVSERMKDIVAGRGGTVNDAMMSRYMIWENRLRDASESLVLGVGASKSMDQTADNGYIMVLYRAGLVGVFCYLGLLLAVGVRGLRGMLVSTGLRRAVILGCLLVLTNHMLFEVTADLFFHVKYAACFAAFAGLLCGQAADAIDRGSHQNYAQPEPFPSAYPTESGEWTQSHSW